MTQEAETLSKRFSFFFLVPAPWNIICCVNFNLKSRTYLDDQIWYTVNYSGFCLSSIYSESENVYAIPIRLKAILFAKDDSIIKRLVMK